MIVKGWNNGKQNNTTGSGYGVSLTKEDRSKFFKESWESIMIDMDGSDPIQVKLSKSFWKDCIELRSSKIGKWLINKELAPWKKNNPPNLELEYLKRNHFRLTHNVDFEKEYSEDSFWKKISRNALKAGKEVVLNALTLYYCLQDKDTPTKAKITILGALGYFIVMLDAIPDFTPVIGYGDDLGAIVLAMGVVAVHIKPEHRIKAEKQLKLLFRNS